MFGAALFFGDGFITPAISVLSAMEGLAVATPRLEHFVLPGALLILTALFLVQRRGTGAMGRMFGPVTLVWFVTLALLGVRWIITKPDVVFAINPLYAVQFFAHNGCAGFVTLASVFLAVTGGEALYADMGHFGRAPIRRGWFVIVLPALVLNYFGQGALLLENPSAIANPFYLMAPGWLLPVAHRAGDRGDGDRFAGRHLRRVLDHAPGAQSRLSAAAARRCIPRKKRSARCTCRR